MNIRIPLIEEKFENIVLIACMKRIHPYSTISRILAHAFIFAMLAITDTDNAPVPPISQTAQN
jgi:hypothetical protein